MRKYAARLKQFFRCAALDNLSVAQNDNLIRLHQRRHAVRNQDERRAARRFAQTSADGFIRLGVHRGQRVVKDHDGGMFQQRSGDCRALLLSAGEGHAALANNRIIAVLKAGNRIMQTGFLRRLLDFRLTDAVFGDGDILRDRS